MKAKSLTSHCPPTEIATAVVFLILLSVLMLLVVGCNTYKSSGAFREGFSETQLAHNKFNVRYEGSSVVARDYCLLRAGEVAIAGGFPYFAVVKEQSHANNTASWLLVEMQTECYKSKPDDNAALEAEFVVKSLKGKHKIRK